MRILVPARNEAKSLPQSLPGLLTQDYPGIFDVLLIDDSSEDGTADAARRIAEDVGQVERLTMVAGEPLPSEWTGKLWALQQGIEADPGEPPGFFLLTDADISHPQDSLRNLVFKAQSERLDMVSLMAQLGIENLWEHLLVPAYVFFFAMLYPFHWVNDPNKATAAAAGGCILIRREPLLEVGGFESIANRVIDDCALAKLIKSRKEGRIWLGLTHEVRSSRSYSGLSGIWATVARTAFAPAQLFNTQSFRNDVGHVSGLSGAASGWHWWPCCSGSGWKFCHELMVDFVGHLSLADNELDLLSRTQVVWVVSPTCAPVTCHCHSVHRYDLRFGIALLAWSWRGVERQDVSTSTYRLSELHVSRHKTLFHRAAGCLSSY